MAYLNDAFINNLSTNCILNKYFKYTPVKKTIECVEVTDQKYDSINNSNSNCEYVCNICNGDMVYHMLIIGEMPHDFIKDGYKL